MIAKFYKEGAGQETATNGTTAEKWLDPLQFKNP